jgi:Ca-activated chloride channel family protein
MFGYARIRSDVDEETLQAIAERTGAAFFRAHDPNALAAIFGRIDEMERTRREVRDYTRYRELFFVPALLALLLLATEGVLSAHRFRRVPG